MKTLTQAVDLLRAHQFDAASVALDAVLAENPDQPDALHFSGILAHQNGDSERAVELIRRSLESAPAQPSALNNLGNIYRRLGRTEEAAQAYFAALQIDDTHCDTWSNLGAMMLRAGNFEHGVEVLRQSIAIDPQHPESWHNLGLCLMMQGKIEDAGEALETCVGLARLGKRYSRHWYAYVLGTLGRTEAVVKVLSRELEKNPDDAVARHLLGSIRGDAGPRASDGYVRDHFNSFSESFDSILSKLEYRAPELVAARVKELLGDRPPFGEVIDLGCGTGLCGPLVRPFCARLTGVDLSGGMLENAARRGGYDQLIEGEITAFLAAVPAASFDLAISADTLVYFGDLAPVFSELKRTLRPGAHLVATVEMAQQASAETTAKNGYKIAANGRYIHTRDYLMATAVACGLTMTGIDNVILRNEGGSQVHGLIFNLDAP